MKTIPRGQARAIIEAHPDAPIRIHTFQERRAVDEAVRMGRLVGSAEHAAFPEAYDWMRRQMQERLGHASGLPVWAWLRRPDCRRKMLDPGDLVRLTAIVPRSRLLISDRDMWDAVVNDGHLSLDEREGDEHDARWPERVPRGHADWPDYEAEIMPTWERVFDPLADLDPAWHGNRSRLLLQACLAELRMDEVVAMRHYGRNNPERRDSHP